MWREREFLLRATVALCIDGDVIRNAAAEGRLHMRNWLIAMVGAVLLAIAVANIFSLTELALWVVSFAIGAVLGFIGAEQNRRERDRQ